VLVCLDFFQMTLPKKKSERDDGASDLRQSETLYVCHR
jgi:hypothetical protein